MPPKNIRLTRIPPPSLQSPRYAHLNSERPELSPLSAGSRASSDASDWIGSGTDTVGGRTPVVDRRLSFIPADSDYAESDGDGDDRSPRRPYHRHHAVNSSDEDDDDDDDLDDPDHNDKMARPFYNRGDSHSGAPLLNAGDDDRGRARYNHSRTPSPSAANARARPHLSRRSTMRSQSPDNQAKMAAKKKYLFASVFLVISLVSFTIQTELAAYVQNEMGWNKAYCMLYMTHGSWALLWPVQLLILRLQKWDMPFKTFWRRHVYVLRSTAHMVRSQELDVPKQEMATSPLPYLVKTTAFVTTALTVAGLGWYLAVNMTTPSDLTAIYNCSAFFAYAFSVPLLKEKLRLDKSIAVGIAIFGVLVVAYGDSRPGEEEGSGKSAGRRFLGNLIIGLGSVLYGLYEVLYKRYACPPEGVSPGRGMIFANAFGSCIGFFTLTVLWLPLPILHMLGWETFELPTGETALWLWLSVVMNATFAGSFLVLISLTSPVLSSVASLLTIFIVAITDWLRTGKAISLAALAGGIMIIVAFLMLSWSTWREMTEDAREKAAHHALEQEWDSEDESDKEEDRRT